MNDINKSIKKSKYNGKVFVFEGIDHVGKSTIISEVSKCLGKVKILHSVYSFPGKESRTLGALVYNLHHNQDTYFEKHINPLSLQMLHVAAHIDTIENRIIPDLKAGKIVLLDRFWWSTYAYGVANGIKKGMLKDIILLEKRTLTNVDVGQYFYIIRKNIRYDYGNNFSKSVLKAYSEITNETQKRGLLTVVENDFELAHTVEIIVKKILDCLGDGSALETVISTKDSLLKEKVAESVTYNIKPFELQTTEVYDTYWKFAAKRQSVFFNRFNGGLPPWTDDTILQKYKFTNAYRASDRVSQYLIKEVIYNNRQYSPEDIFFRIILFKLFNKIDTWEHLQNKLGDISFKNYRYELYNECLLEVLAQKKTIYSPAYIMPSGKSSFGHEKKHQNNLLLLEKMMRDHLPMQIARLKSMKQLYELLLSYPTLGKFLAFQYCIDINYSELCNYSEMSFVVAGPGARDGIKKCFLNAHDYSDEYIIKYMTESQEKEFKRLNLYFQSLWGRPLQLIDCQNLFCEIDKYTRVAFPANQGISQRKRIKQLFSEHTDVIDYFYPPKWNINHLIKRGCTK